MLIATSLVCSHKTADSVRMAGSAEVDNNFELSAGFPPKKRPGTRAITGGGHVQNNFPLFVWQNQVSFMQSVLLHV